MWGVFVKRISFDKFAFQTGDTNKTLVLDLKALPVLNLVRYLVATRSDDVSFIQDGVSLPWSLEFHNIYYPNMEFKKDFKTTYYQVQQGSNLLRWLQFDVFFHVSNLVPGRPLKEVVGIVKSGDFKKLVYEYGGVDFNVLERFTPNDEELLLDAYVIDLFTKSFIRSRKIWMTLDDLGIFFRYVNGTRENQYLASTKRLFEKNVLVLKNEAIAFKWALDLLPSSSLEDTGDLMDLEILSRRFPVAFLGEKKITTAPTPEYLLSGSDTLQRIRNEKKPDEIYLIISDEGRYYIWEQHSTIVRCKDGSFGVLTLSNFRNNFGSVPASEYASYEKVMGLTFLEAFKWRAKFASVDKVIVFISPQTPKRFRIFALRSGLKVYYIK